MTQEDKELLLKDLCGRLPYGVICEDRYGNALKLNGIDKPNNATFKCSDKNFWTTDLDECKPYLFPMSSMTEEQRDVIDLIASNSNTPLSDVVDFYNKKQPRLQRSYTKRPCFRCNK